MDPFLEALVKYGIPLAVLFLCTVAWATNVFSLPGNWISLLFALLYGGYEGFSAVPWWALTVGFLLAGVGELAEFLSGWHGARKSGGSRWTAAAAVAGSIVGALFGAAFGWGLGAIPGTVLGAFLGALSAEVFQRNGSEDAVRRGLWAGFGRAFGLAAKLGCGAAFLVLLTVRILWGMIS